MEKLREDTIRNVRACLISVKGAIQVNNLRKDYQQLMGEDIPFKRCGFKSLEEFLRSEPSLTVNVRDGNLWIDAKVSQKTSHISQMVAQQKTGKKKRAPFKRPQCGPPRFNNRQPVNKWKTANQRTVKFENSPRLAAVNHKQFVNPPTPKNQPNNQNSPPTQRPIHYVAPKSKQIPTKPVNQFTSTKPNTVNNNNSESYEGFTRKQEKFFATIKTDLNNSPEPTKPENPKNNSCAPNNDFPSSDESTAEDKIFVPSGNTLNDLENFTHFHKLGKPVYKIKTAKGQKKKKAFYICQLLIDQESWLSISEEFHTEEEAKLFCANQGWSALMEKYGLVKKKPSLLSNEKDILERIPILIKKHFNGVWSDQIADDYKDLYNEQLPLHWLNIIKRYPHMTIEEFGNKHLLRFCHPEDRGRFDKLPVEYDISIPTSTVNFDDNNLLSAVIMCANSAQEIWCRQIETEYESMFEKILEEMEVFYNDNYVNGGSLQARLVTKGGYYAAWIEDAWYRVRTLRVDDENKEVQCYLVDRGEDLRVNMENLYVLLREFAKVPEQAFLVRLFGIEDLYDISIGSEHIHNLEGREVTLELFSPVEDQKTDIVGVVMYDRQENSSVAINMDLLNKLCIDNALPEFNLESLYDVIITNIEANGDLYVQIPSVGKDKLMSMIKDLTPKINTFPKTSGPITPQNSKNKLFFHFDENENSLNRIKIIDWDPKAIYAQIYFIDFGNTSVINLSKVPLYALDEVDTVINSFPAQAVLVRLDNLQNINLDNFEKNIKSSLKDNQGTLLKVTTYSSENVPLVKINIRGQTGVLFSMNESLTMKANKNDLNPAEKLEELISMKIEEGAFPSSGILKEPPIPNVGKFLEVTVPLAANPWNFIVQPRETNIKLSKLMKEMKSVYSNSPHTPLSIGNIKPGQIYVSRSKEDGSWLRTSVIKVLNKSSISVYYCDYGNYELVSLDSLLPIRQDFLELPYQAIKARLAGVKPRHGKWSLNDCATFQKLVCKKEFVSVVVSIETDELYRCDKVLGLKLIDTSTLQDVHIVQLLVDKKIATVAETRSLQSPK